MKDDVIYRLLKMEDYMGILMFGMRDIMKKMEVLVREWLLSWCLKC